MKFFRALGYSLFRCFMTGFYFLIAYAFNKYILFNFLNVPNIIKTIITFSCVIVLVLCATVVAYSEFELEDSRKGACVFRNIFSLSVFVAACFLISKYVSSFTVIIYSYFLSGVFRYLTRVENGSDYNVHLKKGRSFKTTFCGSSSRHSHSYNYGNTSHNASLSSQQHYVDENNRQINQQFVERCTHEGLMSVTPFEHGGYDCSQGNTFNQW